MNNSAVGYAPLFPLDEHLPFGPASSQRPLTLYQAATIVRNAVGCVWHVDHQHFGIILRAEICKKQIRLVKLKLGRCPSQIQQESNSKQHILTTIDELESWLAEVLQAKNISYQ